MACHQSITAISVLLTFFVYCLQRRRLPSVPFLQFVLLNVPFTENYFPPVGEFIWGSILSDTFGGWEVVTVRGTFLKRFQHQVLIYEIWSSRSGHCEDCYLLGCDAVQGRFFALKIEVAGSYERMVNFYQTARQHIS